MVKIKKYEIWMLLKKFLGHLSSSKPMTFKACRCFREIAERCFELIWLIVDSEIDMPSHIKMNEYDSLKTRLVFMQREQKRCELTYIVHLCFP